MRGRKIGFNYLFRRCAGEKLVSIICSGSAGMKNWSQLFVQGMWERKIGLNYLFREMWERKIELNYFFPQ